MEHPLTDNWFVLRDLTRPNAKRPAYRLLAVSYTHLDVYKRQNQAIGVTECGGEEVGSPQGTDKSFDGGILIMFDQSVELP